MENNRLKYRLKFSKTGRIRFIGHLDLLNVFHKAIKRAKLPVAYSRGFNPHQETVFALPLGLGIYGLGEYVDIIFTEEIEPSQIISKLNEAMPQGIEILGAKRLSDNDKSCAAIIGAASYTAIIPKDKNITSEQVQQFIGQNEIIITKKTKKGFSQSDIKAGILEFSPEYENNRLSSIYMLLIAGSEKNVKAEAVISALFSFCQIEYNPHAIIYTRENLFTPQEKGYSLLGGIM